MREALQDKLQQDGVDHSTGMTSDGQMVVSIISPLMKRAHSLREAGEMVFLDASGGMDGHLTRLFLLLTHCPGGGVPLGAFLTTSESEEAVTIGLAQLKQLAGETGFNCRGIKGPMVFMVDDARAEHAAIMSTYPDATILLCSFHVQQAVWRWIWKGDNKVLLRDRNGCMDLFRRLLYSETEGDYLEIYETDHSCFSKYSNYAAYLASLHNRRQLWALCYRQDTMTRGNNTNNFVEAAFRLLKDAVLGRARAFNVCHLADFLITKFETVISNRLLDIAHGRQELKLRRKEPTRMKAIVTHKHGEQYEVGIGKTKRLVQADLGLCSCFYGRCGNLCKHIWAVMDSKDFGSGVHHYKPRTKQQEQLFWLATAIVGEEMVENESDTGATREMCFSDLKVIPKITPHESERWQAAIDAFHKEMSEKLQTSYEAAMYGPAFETFFGRAKIGVQPAAVARRKKPLGTSTSQHGGTRRKTAADHQYQKENKKRQPAPHNLSFCLERKISLGKNHSKK
ncbi:uncharacterized protein [Watersipora subatra]|uniref:uncharacterized protein n=1 Tax=Watersipora subatra TaxID=2589382 RepID=UPI00355C0A83